MESALLLLGWEIIGIGVFEFPFLIFGIFSVCHLGLICSCQAVQAITIHVCRKPQVWVNIVLWTTLIDSPCNFALE